jgi:hypothetical protein
MEDEHVLFGFQFRSHFSGLDSIAQICIVFLFVLMVSVFSCLFRFSLLLDSRAHRIP